MRGFEDFLRTSSALNTEEELFAYFGDLLRDYGVDNSVYFNVIPGMTANTAPTYNPIYNTFELDFFNGYIAGGHARHDPVQRHARRALKPFRWYSVSSVMELSRPDKLCLDYAKTEYADGLTFPFFNAHGRIGTMNLGRRDGAFDWSPEQKLTVGFICQQMHNRYLEMNQESEAERPKLSVREADILLWVALGKSNADIGDILAISEHTVDTYLRRSFIKLGTNNRMAAVVRAISLGLINP